ncbi:acyl-CoA synthetases /AMP-acid ligases II [Aspergillus egyptiacus]|nr:acyl-CoA synthetases /AMP-acid ligases II [Aspergillus egyptiacus]
MSSPGQDHTSRAGTASLANGPPKPPLQQMTIGEILKSQSRQYPNQIAVIAPYTSTRLTYRDLDLRTTLLAQALLAAGISGGDHIGILAGNTVEFVEVFLATARIGAVAVLLNTFWTPYEVENALRFTECSMLFIGIGLASQSPFSYVDHLIDVKSAQINGGLPLLKEIVLLSGKSPSSRPVPAVKSYEDFLQSASSTRLATLDDAERDVQPTSLCNFQFTSGTTGLYLLSNIVNNGYLTGHRIRMSREDVMCCVSPLFHVGGLSMGLMGCLTHAATIVFPWPTFDPTATLNVLHSEKCTGMHGVSLMFAEVLAACRKCGGSIRPQLRTGTIGGSQASPALLSELYAEFGLKELGLGYGMTETSPLSYLTTDARMHKDGWLDIMPHTRAKIINPQRETVPVGTAGEICIAGYLVHQGYYCNAEKTREAMQVHEEDGLLWMHTGDQAVMNETGQCRITGRLKEIIIRGGVNIYPDEIEARLQEHPAISLAAVVGVRDGKYGEVVAAFLSVDEEKGLERPTAEEIRIWVQLTLAEYKTPAWVFYLGIGGVPDEFPKTASGKIRKTELVAIADRLTQER